MHATSFCLAALLAAAPAFAQTGEAPVVEGRIVDEARSAYNDQKYDKAATLFLEAVQANPAWAELYRDLGRSRAWTKDHTGAIVAYRLYLDLATNAADRDKIQAELELALRAAGNPDPPPGPSPQGAAHLTMARERATAGEFDGEAGAYAALDAAVATGYIGPDLARARTDVVGLLEQRSVDAIEAWWAPKQRADALTLVRILSAWDGWTTRRPLTPQQRRRFGAVRGLAQFATHDWTAAIEALAEPAAHDPRMRYAQAIALARAGRSKEAAQAAAAVADAIDDPRVHLLHGLLLGHIGGDAVPPLRRAVGF